MGKLVDLNSRKGFFMKKKILYISLLTIFVISIFIRIFYEIEKDKKEDMVTTDGLLEATVVKIVDGDTIVVNYSNQEHKVRLIGIDTPESVNADESKNTKEGVIASDFLKSILFVGNTVYLEKDVSDTDKYGRLLRYVWLNPQADINNDTDFESYCLNAIIMCNGMAKPMSIEPDTKRKDLIANFYDTAVKDKVGLWK